MYFPVVEAGQNELQTVAAMMNRGDKPSQIDEVGDHCARSAQQEIVKQPTGEEEQMDESAGRTGHRSKWEDARQSGIETQASSPRPEF